MEIESIKEHLKVNDKRGIMGMDTAKQFVLTLMTLIVIGVTTLIVLNSLGDTSVVEGDNGTQNVIDNATSGIESFFGNTATWLALLSVVIIILIISAVIVVVNRFGQQGARTSL